MSFISEPTWFQGDPEAISLREYQSLSITELRDNIRKGVKSQILASMVGSGKTVCAAYLLHECWQKGKHGVFVVDRLSLLGQTSMVLDRYGIPHGVIQAQHPRRCPGELIQVASVQTLKGRGWPQADLVIIDEAHVLFAEHKRKLENMNGSYCIGLTATPFTRGLAKHFQAIVNVTTGNKLTAEGFLVPFKVFAAKEPNMTGAKVTAGEWTNEEASTRSMPIIGDVVKEYQSKGEGRKFIAFGVDVAHCEELQRQLLSAGINVSLYTYRTGDEEREAMLQEFRKPDSRIRGLISVAALSRGFDVPDVGCIIMCRPLKSSLAEFIQILGRGLRPFPGKSDCVILDLAGNFIRHYPALVQFMEEGVNELDDGKPKPKTESKPREKKPVKCPRCAFLPCSDHCPSCGYIFPPRASVQHEEGQLGEFDAKGVLRFDRDAKRALYAELRFVQEAMGWKSGWAAWAYKRQTGVWPQGLKDTAPEPPSDWVLRQTLSNINRGRVLARIANESRPQREADLFA